MKREAGRAEFVFHADAEGDGAFASLRDMERHRRALHDFQLRRRLGRQCDLGVFAGAGDIVRDRHTDLELVVRRDHRRHARRDDEGTTNGRFLFARTRRVRGESDRHDGERAVEIIGHIVGDFAFRRVGIDDPRPEDDRLFGHALKGVEALLGLAVAARRGRRAQDGKLGQNEIDDLRRLDRERRLAEKIA